MKTENVFWKRLAGQEISVEGKAVNVSGFIGTRNVRKHVIFKFINLFDLHQHIVLRFKQALALIMLSYHMMSKK